MKTNWSKACVLVTLIHQDSVCSLALALASPIALSQTGSPGLKAAVDAAWQRSPQARMLEARRDESVAGREARPSWIAGSPAVGLSQRSDRWTDRNGVRETDLSLSAPFWLPGQRIRSPGIGPDQRPDDLEAQIASARLVYRRRCAGTSLGRRRLPARH